MSFLKKLILNYVLKKYKDKIRFVDILESPFIGNNKCHYNAISYLKLHKLEEEYRIVGGIQIFEDEIVIHFLLENIEKLEQLRAIYNGHKIAMVKVKSKEDLFEVMKKAGDKGILLKVLRGDAVLYVVIKPED